MRSAYFYMNLFFWHIFAHLVGNLSLGGGLAPAGDVGAVKDPENILNQSRFES